METNPRVLRVALAQLNPTVGDLEGNGRKAVEWTERALDAGADLVAFPELFLTGYPPEDLLLKPSFIRDNLRQLEKVAAAARGIALVVGFVDMGNDIYNAAAFAFDGEVKGVYHKYYLPNYGVFDEERYFRRGGRSPLFVYQGVRIGLSICEDAWYPSGPLSVQALHGAELLVNINGSPYHAGKREARETMIRTRAMDARAFMAWVNTCGGQDELVFDGNSVVYGPEGQVIAHAPSFEETLLVGDLDAGSVFSERLHDTRLRREAQEPVHVDMAVTEVEVGNRRQAARNWLRAPIVEPLDGASEVYAAVVTGTRDYVRKNGFAKTVLGLSGGVDSALTAAIAADALGPQNVIGVLMPSRYTSAENLEDAAECAEALGIQTLEIPIEPAHRAFEEMFKGLFKGTKVGVAEENIQPRIRGIILMALSNKFGYLLLSTGNKSELATGYCTLYGDMAGGFAVLKDITKTQVYELCKYRNSLNGGGGRPPGSFAEDGRQGGLPPLNKAIPERILSKAPSAELRENQKDSDSLPPYEVLDPILRGYVEDDRSYEELVAAGHDPATVTRVIQLVDRSEYKRRQAPPGVKITPRAFGRDRRMPLTNRYAADGQAPVRAAGRKSRR